MQRFVVTGANKGIGLAIVKGLLEAEPSVFVFLGSRDMARGQNAVDALIVEDPTLSGRVEALQIDVADSGSVSRAAEAVRARFSETATPLTGLVNNAGVMIPDFSPPSFRQCIEVNFKGLVQTTEAFLPLLDPSGGRVVSISSSSGPSFVADCSPERKALMRDPSVTMPQIMALAEECLSFVDSGGDLTAKFKEAGLNGVETRSGYGVSKALVNMYSMMLARSHPTMLINACTPGFILTDLAKKFANSEALKGMGAKPPSEGAQCPVFLAVGKPPGSGWYFGSDGLRSPLDRYRSPGAPAYTGED